MSNIRLSIIIPVYNVEKYIRNCLDSIFSAINKNFSFEVIVVDDETPDNSMAIVDEYAGLFSNLHVLHQKNQGQGVARNTGLSKAQGDYVWFVDSDDWIEDNAISILFEYFDKYPQIDLFGIPATWKYTNESENWVDLNFSADYRLSGKQYLERRLQLAAWQFVVKRCLLIDNQILYYPGILHEDGLWGFEVMYKATQVLILSSPLYCYRQRIEGSVMRNISIQSAYDIITIHKQKMLFMEKSVLVSDKGWFMKMSLDSLENSVAIVWHLRHTDSFKKFLSDSQEYRIKVCKQCFPLGGIMWKVKCLSFMFPVVNKYRRIIVARAKKLCGVSNGY